MARTQVFGVTAEPSSLSLEDICNAQAADDSLQPVIQALMDGVKSPMKVYVTIQKRHVSSSSNGIHSSSKTAFCTGVITTQMVPLGTYKL